METIYERPFICGNYTCELKRNGNCAHMAVAIDSLGKCVMCKPEDGFDFSYDEETSM